MLNRNCYDQDRKSREPIISCSWFGLRVEPILWSKKPHNSHFKIVLRMSEKNSLETVLNWVRGPALGWHFREAKTCWELIQKIPPKTQRVAGLKQNLLHRGGFEGFLTLTLLWSHQIPCTTKKGHSKCRGSESLNRMRRKSSMEPVQTWSKAFQPHQQ